MMKLLKQADPIGSGINRIIAQKKVVAKPRTIKDVIQSVAKSNAITEKEARRELESSNVITPGISDDAVIGASKEAQFKEKKPSPQIDRKKLSELREKLQEQKDEIEKQEKIQKTLRKLTGEQDKRQKLLEKLLKAKKEKLASTEKQEPPIKIRTGVIAGVDPLAVDIAERQDIKFQIARKTRDLEQIGFAPILARERAKLLVRNELGLSPNQIL
jgi:hypothetical protein